jgi:hypothetical protein
MWLRSPSFFRLLSYQDDLPPGLSGESPSVRIAGKEAAMSIELTGQQRQALQKDSECPPRVIDRATNTTYVLVRADVYENIQALLAEEGVRLMEPLLAELAPEDWEDLAHYENRP